MSLPIRIQFYFLHNDILNDQNESEFDLKPLSAIYD